MTGFKDIANVNAVLATALVCAPHLPRLWLSLAFRNPLRRLRNRSSSSIHAWALKLNRDLTCLVLPATAENEI